MSLDVPSSLSIAYHHTTTGQSTALKQQQSISLPLQYNCSDLNMITSVSPHHLPSMADNERSSSLLSSQNMNHYYSQYATIPMDRTILSFAKYNHMKSHNNMKTGNSN